MSTLDILFLAKNRLEYTRQSLAALEANTNWGLVRSLWLCDDGSDDGTDQYLGLVDGRLDFTPYSINLGEYGARCCGSPAEVMNRYVTCLQPADIFAKIDNDVIVPPGWLDSSMAVMEAHPELDLLGIEPPASRTPHYADRQRKPAPEETGTIYYRSSDSSLAARRYLGSGFAARGYTGYAVCDSIGGIGLMRTRCFVENRAIRPHSTYGGFTEWQLEHPKITKGWMVPPLPLFLLDRMPTEPWVSLGKEYERRGWQREWSHYDTKDAEKLWGWWRPV